MPISQILLADVFERQLGELADKTAALVAKLTVGRVQVSGQIFGDASIDQMRILINFDQNIEVLHGDFGRVLEISEHEEASVGAQTHTMRTKYG